MRILQSIFILGLFAAGPLVCRAEQTASLNRKVSIRADLLYISFYNICLWKDIPCGIMFSASSSELKELPGPGLVSLTGSTMVVLDKLMKHHSQYRWEKTNGVINILPKKGLQPNIDGKNPLGRRIKNLNVSDMASNIAVRRACAMAKLKPPGTQFVPGLGFGNSYAEVNLHLSDVTLREALNELVKADGMMIWRVYVGPKGNEVMCDTDSWRRTLHLVPSGMPNQEENKRVILKPWMRK